MSFDLIVTQYDDHNEDILMLCNKFKVSDVLMIADKKDINKINNLKELYKKENGELTIRSEFIQLGNYNEISNILDKCNNAKMLVNLRGGERINSLLLLKYASEKNIQSIYVDILNKKRYVFGDNFRVISQELEDMSIDEITKVSGANIVCDSSDLCSKKDIVDITNIILKNLDLWHKYKQKLYDNSIFIHDYKDSTKVTINKEMLEDEESHLLYKILKYLKSINGIGYFEERNNIKVNFNNTYLKAFLFKSGTWLEVLTNIVIDEIKEIDEVKNSVVFFWSDDAKRVRNELDVVAVKDSVLVCVSCKDSDKYDENALNELEVYSEKLGGKKAIKILVATKQPIKKSVVDRAREMNINLVIIDKDINKFRKQLSSIINK